MQSYTFTNCEFACVYITKCLNFLPLPPLLLHVLKLICSLVAKTHTYCLRDSYVWLYGAAMCSLASLSRVKYSLWR